MEKKIDFWGDYHTHTVYSHGKGTIADNVLMAESLGLKQIAISDHGLRHIAFSLNRRDLIKVRNEIDSLKGRFNTDILFGIEANIIGADGTVDLKDKDLPFFDIILCGFHKMVLPSRLTDCFGFVGGNVLHDFLNIKSSNSLVKRNTKAFIDAIIKYNIDILTHIGYGIAVDYVEIAKAARDYGTLIELNGKRISCTDEQIYKMAQTGVSFIANSDAHTPQRVGDYQLGAAAIKRLDIPKDHIANWEKVPVFRSKTVR